MSLVFTVAYLLCWLYTLLLFGRMILDLVRSFARQWRPRGVSLILSEALYTLTDPPVKLARRYVPPLRMGPVALDLAFTVVLLLAIIATSVFARFI